MHGENSILDLIKMKFIMGMESNNSIYSYVTSSFLILLLTILMNNKYMMYSIFYECFEYINHKYFYRYKYNYIYLDGKRTTRTGEYVCRTDNLFSYRFQALWNHINSSKVINLKNDINSIKEYPTSGSHVNENYEDYKNNDNDNDNDIDPLSKDIFIVNQNSRFIIGDNIYCQVKSDIDNLDRDSTKKNMSISSENIMIKVYSNCHSLKYLTNFIDDITKTYINNIYNKRLNKRFIYSFIGASPDRERSYNNFSVWEECEFISTRNFNNIFFDEKTKIMDKINFFNNNFEWYKKEGHPYTLGIGLYGPPGTGKTSIIKCIANELNRHLIVIPLNKIKTQREFSNYYFENQYSKYNKTDSVDFSNKIIVLEDIDCMIDIVKDRKSDTKVFTSSDDDYDTLYDEDNNDLDNDLDNLENKKYKAIYKKLSKKIDKNNMSFCSNNTSDNITLSFILNIIDGIRETPGRILIITSNKYNCLDKALIRPGRIDIKLEMKNATVQTICNMYTHYYCKELSQDVKHKLIDYKISPATIVNIHLASNNCNEFIDNLLNYF